MKNYILLILILYPLLTYSQLTGYWQSDVGGCYQIRQAGNEVWWIAERTPGARASITFHGYIVDNILTGKWCDMPSHDRQNCGQVISLRIENNNRMVKTAETMSFYGSLWTRLSSPCSYVQPTKSSFLSASSGKNRFLIKNEFIVSPSGKYFLHMQKDGNLVLYRGSGPNDRHEVIWDSKTYTGQDKDSYMAIQDDGNLVVYRGSPRNYKNPVWSSKTYREKGNYFIAVQDNGKIIIAKGTGPNDNQGVIWTKP